jgi:glycerophosphoryl diester phosphodiesterase
MTPLVVAHRGASREAPENSLPAFLRARALGARAQELDVRRTADGIPVVLHDPTLGRTAHPGGRVDRMTLAELRRARLRPAAGSRDASGHAGTMQEASAPVVPTLREVLESLPDAELTLDVKDPAALGAVIGLVQELDRVERTILYAEGGEDTEAFRAWPGRRATSTRQAVRFALDRRWAQRAGEREPPDVVHTPLRWWGVPIVTPELAERAREQGRFLQVWTVDDPGTMTRLAEWGVGGVITNEVRRALELFGGPGGEDEGAGSQR